MPAVALVTEMYFDENSEVPKLFFKPVRPLTDEELEKALEMREHEDTKRAVTMTVAQTDGVQKVEVKEAPKPAAKPRANAIEAEEPEPEVEVEAAEEVVSEPKKARKKAEPPPADDADLADIVDSFWDD
jgi:Cu2+-containing amine oxidase